MIPFEYFCLRGTRTWKGRQSNGEQTQRAQRDTKKTLRHWKRNQVNLTPWLHPKYQNISQKFSFHLCWPFLYEGDLNTSILKPYWSTSPWLQPVASFGVHPYKTFCPGRGSSWTQSAGAKRKLLDSLFSPKCFISVQQYLYCILV